MELVKRYYLHIVFALFLAALFLWSTFMISTGILLGCFTLGGFIVLYKRLGILKRLALKFPALFDIGAALLTYLLFGQTIIGLIAWWEVPSRRPSQAFCQVQLKRVEDTAEKSQCRP